MNYVLLSSAFLAVSAVITSYIVFVMNHDFAPSSIFKIIFVGFAAGVSCTLGLVFLFISTQPVSRHFDAKKAFFHFLLEHGMRKYGKRHKARFDVSCKTPRETQEILLQTFLKGARETTYVRENNISEVCNLADFKRKHKLTDYEHYKTYVERTAKGERNVLVNGVPERLVLTSGTTGTGKLIPIKDVQTRSGVQQFILMNAIVDECFPALRPMQPKLLLFCLPSLSKSEGGIDITALSYLPKGAEFGFVGYVPPFISYLINTSFEAFYVQMLFGIRDKDIGLLMCVFTTHLLEVMHLMENKWPQLLEDLSTGRISQDLTLAKEVRDALTKELKGGDPERAAELEKEFKKGFDGILSRIWPRLSFIIATDIINIKDQLARTYCKGVPIYLLSFAGSEGLYGVNLDPFSTSAEFVALINCCVFEFIPEENISESNPDTLLIDEVEVGKKYEMVITGESGLYRYRVGDVVEITGYYHKTPKMKFIYRIGTLLNMVGEKVSSDVVRSAVRDAVSMNCPDVRLVYQAVAESSITIELSLDGLSEVKSKGSHYIFFLELEETSRDLLSEFNTTVIAESIDNNLYSRHRFYQNFKDTKQIHTSTVYIVHPGAFYKLRDYVIANSTATANQFKMLEKLRTEATFELMFKNRIIE